MKLNSNCVTWKYIEFHIDDIFNSVDENNFVEPE